MLHPEEAGGLDRAQERAGETHEASHAPAAHQVVLGLALALTFAAYVGTLSFQFAYDDRFQIVQNPTIHAWRYVPRYFAEHLWSALLPEMLGNYYRPLFLLWLRINHSIFGIRPWGWHLTSVLIHIAATWAVYGVNARVIGDRLTAAIATLIYGLHPIHMEAVAWVSGSSEPLLAVLFLPSFLCYLSWREGARRARVWLGLSILLYAAAMLAKETALVLPILILAYEWIFGPAEAVASVRTSRTKRLTLAIRRALPYFAVTPLYLLARAKALKGLSYTVTPLSFSTIVLTWPSLFWLYVKKLVLPVGLSPFYNTPYLTHLDFANVVLPAAGLVAAGGIVWAWARGGRAEDATQTRRTRASLVKFAAALVIIPILPLLNLSLLLTGDIAHDRYMYLPSVGFAMMGALAIRSLKVGRVRLAGQPAVQFVLAAGLAASYGYGAMSQSLVWSDDLVLYYRSVAAAPNNNNVRINLANVLGERGLYAEAIKLYQEVLARDPRSWDANYNLGYVSYRTDRLGAAEEYLSRARGINPRRSEPYLYLGLTHLKMGRLGDAAREIRQAIGINPEAPGLHFALGMVLKLEGDLPGAVEEFKSELNVDPHQQAALDQVHEIEHRMHGQPP